MTNNERKRYIATVTDAVCGYYGIDERDIYEKKKTRLFSRARGMIFLYLHETYSFSASELSREYKRHKRIIQKNIAQTRDFIRIYEDYRKEYHEIISILESNR